MTADRSSLDPLSTCLDPYDAVANNLPSTLEEHRIELVEEFLSVLTR